MSDEVKQADVLIEASHYAGFWRRLVAIIIDYNLLMICLFPLFVVLGFVLPNQVVVYVPFGLFSPEEIVDSTTEQVTHEDGSIVEQETRIIQQDVLGHWTYFYKETVTIFGKEAEIHDRILIDGDSQNHLDRMELDDFIYWLLILYWSLMEGSKYRASVGKMAMGIQVTDRDGNPLTFLRAFARNISKFLSLFTLLIGFMMAGWTSKKQGLHDMIARCYVVLK